MWGGADFDLDISVVSGLVCAHSSQSSLCVCISFSLSVCISQVDDSVEALDAAAVEAALSLCEEAVSAGHSLSGPWEAQDLKTSEPGPMVQSDPTHGLQAAAVANPGSLEPQTESGRGEAEEGKDCEGQETVQTNVVPSVVADDGLAGSEVTEEGVLGEEGALSTAVKTENEEWTQPELNTPCLDSEDSSGSGKESKVIVLFSETQHTLTHLYQVQLNYHLSLCIFV